MIKIALLTIALSVTACSGAAAQPIATPTLIPTATVTPQPTYTPWPTSTPRPTHTPFPRVADIEIRGDLSPRIVALVQVAMDRLQFCSPEMRRYVYLHINYFVPSARGLTVVRSDRSVALSETQFFNDTGSLPNDIREFFMLITLVHEARHTEQPTMDDELDAHAFTLPLFDQCGYTVRPENQAALQILRRLVESHSH